MFKRTILDNMDSIFIISLIIIFIYKAVSIYINTPEGINPMNGELIQVSEMERDPVFGQIIQGNEPMIVHRYEAGDDIRPDLYEVYYFPEIITNDTKGHYEVYRTLGKDR